MAGTKAKTAKPEEGTIHVDEFEWKNNPMLRLGYGEEDRWAFQFGMGKARRLLKAMEAMGPAQFAEKVRAFLEANAKGGEEE